MAYRDEFGRTALHYAAANGRLGEARTLIESGMGVDSRDTEDALYFAIFARKKREPGVAIDFIRLLHKRGADPTRETIRSYFGTRSIVDVVRDTFLGQQGNEDLIAEFADTL
ncbi:ankyrin repeat domain-containing protein [Rhodococcus sp. BP22]|uniref:ankyrin repeat domain-containing protein n=1 Tax=Rhodococcus sp. BP22 TaxID=2758566 RepID=UPI0016452F37|nr:ankyrin repeat domain-containing protein [Rhodococcus sp. BP22]